MLEIWLAGPLELQLEIEKAVSSNKEAATAALDMKMKNKLANKGSQFNKELLLKGLLKPFPRNCIALMTITGAKGSTVSWLSFGICLFSYGIIHNAPNFSVVLRYCLIHMSWNFS